MRGANKQEEFTLWKRPWQKWLTLTASILQLLVIWMDTMEFRKYSRVASLIFSDSGWADYVAHHYMRCAVHGLAAATFFLPFLISFWVRSEREANLTGGLLLLLLALVWGAAGFTLRLVTPDGNGILWAFLLVLMLVGAAYELLHCRGKADEFD